MEIWIIVFAEGFRFLKVIDIHQFDNQPAWLNIT